MKAIPLVILAVIFECPGQHIPETVPTLYLADSLFATGHYMKAIDHYGKDRSRTSLLQIARSYAAVGHLEKAIAQYERLIQRTPKMQIGSFELGKLLMKVKDYDRACKLYVTLVQMDGNNPEYHYYLGEAYRRLGETSNSVAAFKRAVYLDSTHLRSLFQLGKHYTIKQERDQALYFVDQGLHIFENDLGMMNLKALIYYNDDQYAAAIPWFEKLLDMGEHKKYIYAKLARCYHSNWEFEKAKSVYRRLLELDDQDPETYFGLANTLWRNKQQDSAEMVIKKGLDVQRPIFAKGYTLLAGFARERANLATALEYYKLAYQEDPGNAVRYYQICTVADQYYEDAKTRLAYYERFQQRFGKDTSYFSVTVAKRISELRREIHFSKD